MIFITGIGIGLISIMVMFAMYCLGENDQRKSSEAGYKRYIKECYVSKNKIRDKLQEYKAKTDCRYCNNACDSYAVCMALQELLREE